MGNSKWGFIFTENNELFVVFGDNGEDPVAVCGLSISSFEEEVNQIGMVKFQQTDGSYLELSLRKINHNFCDEVVRTCLSSYAQTDLRRVYGMLLIFFLFYCFIITNPLTYPTTFKDYLSELSNLAFPPIVMSAEEESATSEPPRKRRRILDDSSDDDDDDDDDDDEETNETQVRPAPTLAAVPSSTVLDALATSLATSPRCASAPPPALVPEPVSNRRRATIAASFDIGTPDVRRRRRARRTTSAVASDDVVDSLQLVSSKLKPREQPSTCQALFASAKCLGKCRLPSSVLSSPIGKELLRDICPGHVMDMKTSILSEPGGLDMRPPLIVSLFPCEGRTDEVEICMNSLRKMSTFGKLLSAVHTQEIVDVSEIHSLFRQISNSLPSLSLSISLFFFLSLKAINCGLLRASTIAGNHTRVALEELVKEKLITDQPVVECSVFIDLDIDLELIPLASADNKTGDIRRKLSLAEKMRVVNRIVTNPTSFTDGEVIEFSTSALTDSSFFLCCSIILSSTLSCENRLQLNNNNAATLRAAWVPEQIKELFFECLDVPATKGDKMALTLASIRLIGWEELISCPEAVLDVDQALKKLKIHRDGRKFNTALKRAKIKSRLHRIIKDYWSRVKNGLPSPYNDDFDVYLHRLFKMYPGLKTKFDTQLEKKPPKSKPFQDNEFNSMVKSLDDHIKKYPNPVDYPEFDPFDLAMEIAPTPRRNKQRRQQQREEAEKQQRSTIVQEQLQLLQPSLPLDGSASSDDHHLDDASASIASPTLCSGPPPAHVTDLSHVVALSTGHVSPTPSVVQYDDDDDDDDESFEDDNETQRAPVCHLKCSDGTVTKHQFMISDCLEALEMIKEKTIDVGLIILDPPFGITNAKWDKAWSKDYLKSVMRLLCLYKNSVLVFFCSYQQLAESITIASSSGWSKSVQMTWIKPNHRCGKPGVVAYAANPILILSQSKLTWVPRDSRTNYCNSNVIFSNIADLDTRKRINETEKPVDLIRALIYNHCRVGSVVLDLCSGSGSSSIAAGSFGNSSIAIDNRRQQVENAVIRLTTISRVGFDVCDPTDLFNLNPINNHHRNLKRSPAFNPIVSTDTDPDPSPVSGDGGSDQE